MYNNVGDKIMTLAKVCAWIVLVCSVLCWIIMITDGSYSRYANRYIFEKDNDALGWGILLGGAIYFISSWILYGFGQLVDDVHTLRTERRAAAPTTVDELPNL